MGQRRNRRPVGRPPLITDETIHKDLIDSLKLGVPVEVACDAAGISKSAFYNWCARGYDEHEARSNDPDYEPDESEQAYVDLYLQVGRARSIAAVRNVGVIQKSAQGGTVTEETVKKYRDPDTGELVEERTVKRAAPDWRAAAWYLERSHRGVFAKGAEQVEITGADGGPVQVSISAEDLSQRLTAHLAAGVATPAAIEAGMNDADVDTDRE